MHEITILPELRDLIPPLSSEEFEALEQNCLKHGITDTLKIWDNDGLTILIDGHNRKRISDKHNLPFRVENKDFESIEDVKVWMIDFQLGRRNISDFCRFELTSKKREILGQEGKKRMSEGGQKKGLVENVQTFDARKEIAQDLNWGEGKVKQAIYIEKHASEEIKGLAKSGSISINQAYQRIRKKESPTDREDQKRLITNQIPQAFLKDARQCSIFTFFAAAKQKGVDKSDSELAKEWQIMYSITEDELSVATIVKNWIRMRDEVRKEKDQILKLIEE